MPIIAAVIAASKTAAAAKSLTFPAVLLKSGETRSTRYSTAVFIISEENTKPIANTTITHSEADSLKYTPATVTAAAAKRCIHPLCCVLINSDIPLKAKAKLLALALKENFVPIQQDLQTKILKIGELCIANLNSFSVAGSNCFRKYLPGFPEQNFRAIIA